MMVSPGRSEFAARDQVRVTVEPYGMHEEDGWLLVVDESTSRGVERATAVLTTAELRALGQMLLDKVVPR